MKRNCKHTNVQLYRLSALNRCFQALNSLETNPAALSSNTRIVATKQKGGLLITCDGHVGRLTVQFEFGCIAGNFAAIRSARFGLQLVQDNCARTVVAGVLLILGQADSDHRKRHYRRIHHRSVPAIVQRITGVRDDPLYWFKGMCIPEELHTVLVPLDRVQLVLAHVIGAV